ncbi:MAG TPA: ABC transporter substrate-binding protein [Candidatus Binatia bacterium]
MMRMVGYLPKQRSWRINLASVMLSIVMFVSDCTSVLAASVAEIALYRGKDRETKLIEGAKKEGQLMFYNSNTWMEVVAQEFEKKYPFIKVGVWRSEGRDVLKRVLEEYASGRYIADVVETSTGIEILQKRGFLQEHFSPEIDAYSDDVKEKGKSGGVFFWANRELYIGLGFNTKAVPANDAPKDYAALLDPKWKGKMTMAGGSSGPRWVGHIVNTMGREFLEKLSRQDVKVQNIVPAALANQVVSGEVPLSPTIFDSNMVTAKRKGAPVEWRPLEPVLTNVGSSGMTTRSPHPHAAILFLDYLHSKEGQQVVMKGGLNSPRDDMDVDQKFKKNYLENRYSLEEFEKHFAEWQDLMKRLFISGNK